MKRKEFIRQLQREGCVLLRHGSRHDIYQNTSNLKKQPIPRHKEIDNDLCKHIRKYLGLA